MPVDWTTVDFDQVSATEAPPTLANEGGGTNWDMVNFDQVTEQEAGSGAYQQTFDPMKQANEAIAPYLNYYGARFQRGLAGVDEGYAGMKVLTGEISYADAEAQTKPDAISRLREEDIKSFKEKHTSDIFEWVGPAVESVAAMAEITKGAFVGAAAGAGVGAVTGAITGAVGGPAIAAPTAAASALIGLGWGGRAGAFAVSSQLMAGQTYMQLRRNGISHDTARNASIAAGAVMGAIETLQLDQLGGAGKEAIKAQIKGAAFHLMAGNAIKTYAKTVGLEVAEEELQELTSLVTETVTGVIDKRPDAIPTPKEVQDRLVETFIESAKASAFLVGGSQVGGAAIGATVKGAFKDVQNIATTAPPTALQQAQQEAQQQTQSQNQPSQTITPGQPLTGGVSMSVQEATEKTQAAIKAAQAIKEQIVEIAAKGEVVPEDIRLAYTEANRNLGMAREEKRVAELEQTRAAIEEQITKPGDLTTEQKASLEKDAEAVQNRLREIKLGITKRAVDERIAKIDAELVEDVKSGLHTTKPKRVEQLTKERDTLQTFKELVDQGLLNEKDLDELSTKIPSRSAQTLVNLAAKKILKAGRETRWSTQSEIKNNQKLLTTLIRKSGLSQAQQGQFIAMIANVQTAEHLAAIVPTLEARISEVIARQDLKDATGALDKQLGRIAPKKASSGKVSRFSPESDLQEVLNLYRDYVADPKAAAQAEQDYVDALGKGKVKDEETGLENDVVTDEQKIAHAVASHIAKVNFKDPADVRALAAYLKNTIDNGLRERLAELTEVRRDAQDRNIRVTEGAQGLKRVTITPAGAQAKLRAKIDQVGQWGRAFGRTVFSWEGKLAIAFQDAVIEFQDKLIDELSVHEAIKAADANKRAQTERMWQHLKDALPGKKSEDVIKQVVDGSSKDLREPSGFLQKGAIPQAINQNGETVPLASREISPGKWQALTRNEAIQLWMQIKFDKTLWRGLRDTETGNGYTFRTNDENQTEFDESPDSTEAVLDRLLSDDEKAMGIGLMSFYREYFKRLADEYKAETGLELEQNDNYSGPAFRAGYANEQMLNEFQSQLAAQAKKQFFSSGKPGTTIARVDSALGLAARDAFANAMEHIVTVEHWKAWRLPSKMLSRVFTDNGVRSVIKQKYGGLMGSIDAHLKDLTQGQLEKQADWVRTVNHILSNAGTAFLGLKPLSLVKQLTSWVNFALHVPLPDLISGTFDFFTDLKGHNAILESSTLFEGRYARLDATFLGALQSQELGSLTGKQLKDAALIFLKAGDQVVTRAGGWAVYKHVLKKTDSHEKALTAFEKAFNTTQSSGTMDQLSNLSRNPASKVLTIFLQQPMRMAEFQLTAWRRAANNPNDTSLLLNAIRTSMIIHLAQGLFLAVDAAWLSMVSGDDDEKEEAWYRVYSGMILGPMFPVWGDLISSAVTEYTNWQWDKNYRVWKPKVIPMEALTKTFIDLPHDVFGAIEDGEIDTAEAFTIVLDYARSINLLVGGLPIEPPVKLLRDIMNPDNSLYYGKIGK